MQNVEEKSKIDVDAMCRMCHHQLDSEKSVPIFVEEETSVLPVYVQIKMFAGIEVSSMDAMPKNLCVQCRLHLEKSNLVRNKCKNLEAKMRKHLRIINAGRVSHVFDDEDDENEEEYSDSVKIIEALSQRLGEAEDENGNSTRQMDFESEKKRIFDEAQAHLKAAVEEGQRNLEKAKKEYQDQLESAQKSFDEQLRKQREEASGRQALENPTAHNSHDTEAEIQRLNSAYDALMEDFHELEEELKRKETQYEDLSEEFGLCEAEQERNDSKYADLCEQYEALEADLNRETSSYAELMVDLERAELSNGELTETLNSVEAELERVKGLYQELRKNSDAAAELLERSEKSYKEHFDILRKEIALERECIASMTEAHKEEIKRIKDELENERANEPPMKRKQVSAAPQLNPIDSVEVLVPAATTPVEPQLVNSTQLDSAVDKAPISGEIETGNGLLCRACQEGIPRELEGLFQRKIQGEGLDFCSESCLRFVVDLFEPKDSQEMDATGSDIDKDVRMDDSTEKGIPSVGQSSTPQPSLPDALPIVQESVVDAMSSPRKSSSMVPSPMALKPETEESNSNDVAVIATPVNGSPRLAPLQRASAVFSNRGSTELKTGQRPMSSMNSGIGATGIDVVAMHSTQPSQQAAKAHENGDACATCKKALLGGITTKVNNVTNRFCNLSCMRSPRKVPVPMVVVREKQCFTCKQRIVGDGIAAKNGNVVYHFCGQNCFQRVGVQNTPVRPRAPAKQVNPDARFYCELCDQPYKSKGALKTHFGTAHPGELFNGNIVAQVRSNK